MSDRMFRPPASFLVSFFLAIALFANATLAAPDRKYESLDWLDLLPEEDLKALQNPPSYLDSIEDGSPEDSLDRDIPYGSEFSEPGGDLFSSGDDFSSSSDFFSGPDAAYQQALVSTKIIEELDGRSVRIPGFIVPLEFDDNLTITQFFLVPYFGACIHLPPPPPNQMVLVDYPKGINMDNLYTPLWISGQLAARVTRNDLGTSAYSMQMDAFEMYDE